MFGALALVLGAGTLLLGAASLLLSVDLRASVMGFAVHGMLGAAFVWLGIGSIRRRRWVAPMMLVLAWSWLLGGLIVLPLVPGTVDAALATATGGAEPAPIARLLSLVFVLGAAAVGGVLLPAAFVWVYRDPDLLLTCRREDPAPAWTEACPTPILGLSVGLGALAALTLPMLLRPVVPWFGTLVVGWRGALLLAAGAAACAWLSRETFRGTAAGWWGSAVLLLGSGVSAVVTLARVDAAELYRRLGYPREQVDLLQHVAGGSLPAWLTAAVTAITAVYLLGIRKYFAR